MTAGTITTERLEARIAGMTKFRGQWETDCGTPGPPGVGTGRAAFDVPRLHAHRFHAGDELVVELETDGRRARWDCEVFGVQLPLVPSEPASVRVRALRPAPAHPRRPGRKNAP